LGGSVDVPLDQRGDIHIDAEDTTAAQLWLEPNKAQEWVLAQLKGQGIVMRAASREVVSNSAVSRRITTTSRER